MNESLAWRWTLATFAILCACPSEPSAPPAPPDAQELDWVNESFEELYPLFLLRKVTPGAKAAEWRRYHHRWVRWRGRVVALTPRGVAIKHLPGTITFDVSLHMDPSARQQTASLKRGDEIVYTGQLHSYDDIFRTFYLVRGAIVQ